MLAVTFRSVALACWTIAMLPAGAAAQTPTISLKAVKLNPTCLGHGLGLPCVHDDDCAVGCGGDITPTNEITVEPGDIIVAEIYASEWSPNGEVLDAYRAAIDRAGFFSGSRGRITPLGSEIICDGGVCHEVGCPDGFLCNEVDGCCYGPLEVPWDGVFIDTDKPSFIFCGAIDMFVAVDPPRVLYGALVLSPTGWPYLPPPRYCGTLALQVSEDACGAFTIGFRSDQTYLMDWYNRLITPLTLEPLAVDTGPCEPVIVRSDPPNCAIDARQPSEPDGSNPAGWDSITLEFSPGILDIGIADFSITVEPPVPDPPDLWFLAPEPPTITLNLDAPIPPGHWTCVTYHPSGQEYCVGSLPGDACGDRIADARDILCLVDILNDAYGPDIPNWQCDINRSGLCAPSDILRLIDLLNGADAYDAWLDRTLAPCPGIAGGADPRIGDYSNSGCHDGGGGALPASDYPGCGDDTFEITVEPSTIHLTHANATYNCCAVDIVYSLEIDGEVLRLFEEEVVPAPCFCLCCFDATVTLVDVAPGAYTVRLCWDDYETGQRQCYSQGVVVP